MFRKSTAKDKKKPKLKLSRAEKKQLAELMKQAKKNERMPHSAQQTIPYQRMYPDGICRVDDTHYTKTVRFYDINYQLAQTEDQEAIFDGWCDILNSFAPGIHVQFSFVNLPSGEASVEQHIIIPMQGDAFDSIREEYSLMLQNQTAKGSHGLNKAKYVTFGIEADGIKTAKPRLERIELDLLMRFKRLGVRAEPLDGYDRLKLQHGILHMDDPNEAFQFDWRWLPLTGLSTKDFIAPGSFEFRSGRQFTMGRKLATVCMLQINAAELSDRVLAELLELDSGMVVSLHIQAVDHAEALKMVKRKVTDLDKAKIDEQKKAVRSGYDIDILPSSLEAYGVDVKKLLQSLESHDEHLFMVTFLIMTTADTRKQMENNLLQLRSLAQEKSCHLVTLDFQQEEGLASSLPLGINQVEIQRGLTTSSTGIFVPFTTQELFQPGPNALYYGLNALSNNIIMASRTDLNNANGIILGKPGSGKSFAGKREMLNCFLLTQDDVIICDPESEYYPLVQMLQGQVIRISPTSNDHINPMDINLNYSDEDEPLALKSDFILSLCELIVGGRDGLSAKEKSLIDRAVQNVYRGYLADPAPENMPILGDLYDELRRMAEPEAENVATALELYVTGSLNVFNHRTNVELNNRMVCYDIKQLGQQLKKIGMLVVQDQVWNRVTINRAAHKTTRYYVDEFHLLLREAQTAAYSVEIWKRFRKWGGIPTGITQNVKDLLASREVESIFENSNFIMLLDQAPGDREILAKRLNISKHQLAHITQVGPGEGLLIFGSVMIPFVDHFPKDTMLYRIMSTKPNEAVEEGVNAV